VEELNSRLRQDRDVYALIGAYGLATLLVSVSLHDSHKLVPLVYAALWLRVAAKVILGPVLLLFAVAAASGKLPALKAKVRSLATPQRVSGLVMLVALLVFHGLFTSAKTMLAEIAPFAHDRFLANLDATLHGGDLWRAFSWLTPFTPALQVIYAAGWVLVLIVTLGYACLEAPDALRRRFLWSFLLSWILLGNLVAGLLMSGGPVFYEGLLGDRRFHLLTYSLDHSGIGGVLDSRAMLWNAYVHQSAGVGTGISAFPSLHVAMASLFAIFWWSIDRRLGAAAALFALVIFVSSVHLGWHYGIDGYAAVLGTLTIWSGVSLASAERPRRQRSLENSKMPA
jgi:hypothetical protein